MKRIPQSGDRLGTEIDSYLDMIRVAFTNDSHRVAVLGIGEEREQFTWKDSNGKTITGQSQFKSFHEDIAHYKGKGEDNSRAYIGWTTANAQKIVNFVQDLKKTIDIDGKPLIDNTMIVLTGEVGNGHHDRRHVAHLHAGTFGHGDAELLEHVVKRLGAKGRLVRLVTCAVKPHYQAISHQCVRAHTRY